MNRLPKVLEIIATTVEDAIEAAAGGAGRLELVRSLEAGGLTPPIELVHEVLARVSIPVRVMVRENSSMEVASAKELCMLRAQAEAFSRLSIDGLVLGFVSGGEIDVATTQAVLKAAPNLRATFHRAFEETKDPLEAIKTLKSIGQIDRILTRGGPGSWSDRRQRLSNWQRAALPQMEIIAGGDLSAAMVADLMHFSELRELHVGRAARVPHEHTGAVNREQVALLKRALPAP